jgi:glycosyltransferase involved in cell wall biosynthesis
MVIYALAQAMARRGHQVTLAHVPASDMFGSAPHKGEGGRASMRDGDCSKPPDWFEFDPAVPIRHVGGADEDEDSGDTQIVFGYVPSMEDSPNLLPVVLIQGANMVGARIETEAYSAPCPKICVASWLVEEGRHQGVPEQQLVHVPPGISHDKFRIRTPIDERAPLVVYCHNQHRQKRARLAVEALEELHRSHPGVPVIAFGALAPPDNLPDFIDYRRDPPQDMLVNEILGRASVFLQTSVVEGLGLPAIEAMACGAALVTTDNGGSRDYALPGRTAMVVDGNDEFVTLELARAMAALIDDETTRIRLATAGAEHVRSTFDWGRCARLTEEFLMRYLAAPSQYGRPA